MISFVFLEVQSVRFQGSGPVFFICFGGKKVNHGICNMCFCLSSPNTKKKKVRENVSETKEFFITKLYFIEERKK